MANARGKLVPVLKVLNRVAPKTPILRLKSATISRDPAVVHAYDHDPLIYRGRLRARILHDLIFEAKRMIAQLHQVRLPVLILHGGADALVNPRGSQAIHKHIGSKDKTLKIYPGLFHEILNEPEREEVLSDIAAWLDDHADAPVKKKN
jgi:alpha-beta hydrolase superfamily lysophospholipase